MPRCSATRCGGEDLYVARHAQHGQALIFTIGMTVVMWLSARGVIARNAFDRDFVMINAMLIQLYMPLNFMAWCIARIKQGLVDLEAMFGVLEEKAEVQDKSGAKPLVVRRAKDALRTLHFPTSRTVGFFAMFRSRCRR